MTDQTSAHDVAKEQFLGNWVPARLSRAQAMTDLDRLLQAERARERQRILDMIKSWPGDKEQTVNDVVAMIVMLPEPRALASAGTAPDTNVAAVQSKLSQRSAVGLKKYGVTTDKAGLSQTDWLRHLQEELLDGAVYIEALLKVRP